MTDVITLKGLKIKRRDPSTLPHKEFVDIILMKKDWKIIYDTFKNQEIVLFIKSSISIVPFIHYSKVLIFMFRVFTQNDKIYRNCCNEYMQYGMTRKMENGNVVFALETLMFLRFMRDTIIYYAGKTNMDLYENLINIKSEFLKRKHSKMVNFIHSEKSYLNSQNCDLKIFYNMNRDFTAEYIRLNEMECIRMINILNIVPEVDDSMCIPMFNDTTIEHVKLKNRQIFDYAINVNNDIIKSFTEHVLQKIKDLNAGVYERTKDNGQDRGTCLFQNVLNRWFQICKYKYTL
jgi:hypothetical protein